MEFEAAPVPQSEVWTHERSLGIIVRLSHVLTGLALTLGTDVNRLAIWLSLSVALAGLYTAYYRWLLRQPPTRDAGATALVMSLAALLYINALFYLTNHEGLSSEVWRNGPSILLMVSEVLFAARFLSFLHILGICAVAFGFAYFRAYISVQAAFPRPNEQLLDIMGSPQVWAVVVETWTMIPILLFVLREYHITRTQARTDGLTRLLNHRSFYESLPLLMSEARRRSRPLSLILVDIDHFKALNDLHGHRCGDMVLRTVGKLLQKEVRKTDGLFRYGGEEFSVILVDTDLNEAAFTAERLRQTVENYFQTGVDVPVERLTISAGVAAYPDRGETPDALVEAADRALYIAKRTSRNKVCVAS